MNERAEVETQLRSHVDTLARLIGPRASASSLQATRSYLRQQWTGESIREELFEAHQRDGLNLIIERRGTKRPEQIVLLGAHYDTVTTTPGADDNASAVAMLLEVVRLLADHRGHRTVRYVAFDAEEPPHFYMNSMGSQSHARQCRSRDESIVAMICLEMVGYFRNEPNSQTVPESISRPLRRLFPSRGNFLAAVGNPKSAMLNWRFRRGFKRTSTLPLFSICLPEAIHEIRLSDHSSFWDQGYPAIMLTDTSFLRNSHYHQPSDTPETLDYERMAEATFGVAGAIKRLAG